MYSIAKLAYLAQLKPAEFESAADNNKIKGGL
jgi:hypothetical protein